MRQTWLGASAAAVLSAAALHIYLARFEQERAGGQLLKVVMVTRDVEPGDLLADADLATKQLPERFVEERHVRGADRELVVGARCSAALAAGSAVTWTDVDSGPQGRTLAGLVRSGMRAVSLRGSDVGFEGLLRPGDRVDVLLSQGEGSERRTSTLLQNALVLTVGDDLGASLRKARATQHATSVALSVTPLDAQRLAQVRGRGTLTVALRNPGDVEIVASQAEIGDSVLPSPIAQGGGRAR
jgi:pilus assembly protein CpaB